MASCCAFVVISLAFLIAFSAVTAKPRLQPRILGGQNAETHQLSYMAGIIHKESLTQAVCSGAILNERVILSSALCIDSFTGRLHELIAILGSPDIDWFGDEDQRKNIIMAHFDRIILHPHFNEKTQAFDLALMQTKTKILFSNAIQPIALPTTDWNDETESQALISGWGAVWVRVWNSKLNICYIFSLALRTKSVESRSDSIFFLSNSRHHHLTSKCQKFFKYCKHQS